MQNIPQIVIVGGGAGGLELASRLGQSLGKRHKAIINLVDINLTHVWKPLCHELSAGTLSSNEDEISYIALAYESHFKFHLGALARIDRIKKTISLNAVLDSENNQILPERILNYDLLIIAIGSVSNDFGILGVKENCYCLDNYHDCIAFHEHFFHHLMRIQEHLQDNLEIAVIGGGATGVELAAEIHYACKLALQYRTKTAQLPNIKISIIERSQRILASLPENITKATLQEFKKRGISVYANEQVSEVDEHYIYTKNGLRLKADLMLWAAGIKAPDILANLGFQVNSHNQILVSQTLQTLDDKDIFALGDCASCAQSGTNKSVPPRAQSAHQQALLLVKSISNYLEGKHLLSYAYQDYGSLISLSHNQTLGFIMGRALGNIKLEGILARFVYRFLYRRHQAALFGWWRVILLMTSELLTKSLHPRLKLH